MRTPERDFVMEKWRRFYIAGDYGDYAMAWQKFAETYPDDVAAWHRAADQNAIASLRAEFQAADRDEQGDNPFEPVHVREVFLDLFGIEMPPMTASIDGGPDGRIPAEHATPEQHREAHARIREYHRRGFKYRDRGVQKWDEARDKMSKEEWTQYTLFEMSKKKTTAQ